MSSFFDDLEAQLRSVARARAGAPAAGRDVPRRRRRWRGWVRAGVGAVPVVVAVLMTLVVVGGALVLLAHRGRGSSASPPPGGGIGALIAHTPQKQLRRELGYAFAVMQSVQNSKPCQVEQPTGVTFAHGSPGSSLLSILGVLRRPATPADRPDPGLMAGMPDVYRAYIRRAFSAGGVSYYIIPSRFDRAAESIPSDRCFELQAAALGRKLPKIPAALREPVRQLGAAWIAYERSLVAQAPRDTICLVFGNRNEEAEQCEISGRSIEEGLATLSGATTFSGLVPDGVATVTVIFPAAHAQAPRSVTASVKGNVYVVPVRNPSYSPPSPTVIWRSAQGRVLKRFTNPAARALAAVCRQSQFACLLSRTASMATTTSTGSTASTSPPTSTVPPAPKSARANRKR